MATDRRHRHRGFADPIAYLRIELGEMPAMRIRTSLSAKANAPTAMMCLFSVLAVLVTVWAF
jgi:hypothetical protein